MSVINGSVGSKLSGCSKVQPSQSFDGLSRPDGRKQMCEVEGSNCYLSPAVRSCLAMRGHEASDVSTAQVYDAYMVLPPRMEA